MIPLVLDLETFYDRDFSLSKITTEAYVRDPRFETIGIAIKIGDAPTQWYPQPDVAAALARIDWSDKMVVCQNTAFDGAILKWHYDVSPLAWADILGMSRALYPHDKSHSLSSQATRLGVGVKGNEVLNALGKHYADFTPDELARYAAYCVNDVELTHTLFHRYLSMGFPKQELRLIDATLRMFLEPRLVLDKDLLVSHLAAVKDYKQQLLEDVRDTLIGDYSDPEAVQVLLDSGLEGLKTLLMSNPKFAQQLERLDVVPPMKISPATGKLAYAFAKTDEAFKELAEHPDVRVQALVAARLGNKTTLEETRTERFIGMAGRGAFPVPLRYYGAHSGRWSGQDSVNLQNLPSRGPYAKALKRAIKAPPGHVVIDCDSAQIEARCLAWLAGQHDLVQAFRDKQDVYKIMASHIYGVAADQIDKTQRQVGKVVVLGAGYGVGHAKLKAFLKSMAGVEVTEAEAKRIINSYRNTYSCIPYLWDKANQAIQALASNQTMVIDVPKLVRVEPGKGLTLPSGLHIQYPGLRREYNEDNKPEWRYTTKGMPTRVYGGLCLAADTEVLTRRGWVAITNVAPDDLLWDGVEWVNHMGLTCQGTKPTLVLDGVRMTADHLVLTAEGWVNASSCEGLHRADIRMPDGNTVRGGHAPLHLGVPVPLRHSGDAGSDGYGEGRESWPQPVMRMCSRREVEDARALAPSGVLGVEVYAGPVSATLASGVAQLRRAWDQCVSAVGLFVRGVLGGHGAYIQVGADARPQRQQRRLHPRELPVGILQSTGRQPPREPTSGHDESRAANRRAALHAALPVASEPVYDIINAGPRTRFVVRGATGPMIVHNCVENFTQAIARCVVAEQLLRIRKRYPVVLTVHDSVACIAPMDQAEHAMEYVVECMSWNPKWSTGLPLACEAGMGDSYGDC